MPHVARGAAAALLRWASELRKGEEGCARISAFLVGVAFAEIVAGFAVLVVPLAKSLL